MLKNWVQGTLALLCLLLVLGVAYGAEELTHSTAVGGAVVLVGISLMTWAKRRVFGTHSILESAEHTSDDKDPRTTQAYLHWLIRHSEYRLMEGIGETSDGKIPNFYDLFCDVSSYGIGENRFSLSSWLSDSSLGRTCYSAFLLGPPGSGKSVTLRAVLLSCANSFYFRSMLRAVGVSSNRTLEKIAKARRKFEWFFDSSWILPAPAYVPILINLRRNESLFRNYLKAEKGDFQDALLKPLLRENGDLEFSQFQALLRDGRIVFLCDGLDELDEDLRPCAIELMEYCWNKERQAFNVLLTSCRSGTFESLRDVKPVGFDEVTLEVLTDDDSRRIVAKLLSVELPQGGERTRELFSEVLARPEVRKIRKHLKSKKKLHQWLVKDLREEIVARVPKGLQTWQPSDYPLSLRRMTLALISRPKDLGLDWEKTEHRPRWYLRVGRLGDSLGEYTRIIESDLLELLHRRPDFAHLNGYTDHQMLGLYGELAYNCKSMSYSFSEVELRAFVGRKTKNARVGLQQQVERFTSPGIVTEAGGTSIPRQYGFRDDESASFLASTYMVDAEGADCIDTYIDNHIGHQKSLDEPLMPLQMAFSRLRGEALSRYVRESRHIGNPTVLQAVVLGGIGSQEQGRLSTDEADALLSKCLDEAQFSKDEPSLFTLWVLIRHIIFKQWCSPGMATERLIKLIRNAKASMVTQAQALLVFAERTTCFESDITLDEVVSMIMPLLEHKNPLVRGCAAIGKCYLLPGSPRTGNEIESLAVTIPEGLYKLATSQGMDRSEYELFVPSFRIERFPVLRFQYERFDQHGESSIAPGESFKPVVNVTYSEASRFASSQGAYLPSIKDLEVAAAYSGSPNHRRTYPWGEELGRLADIAFERKALREELGDKDESLPIGLKPSLATPSGIFDLVGNVQQITSTSRESDILVFGPTPINGYPERLRCHDSSAPVAPQLKHRGVGIRLIWK